MSARKAALLINDKYGEFGGSEQYINSFAALFTPLGYEVSLAYGLRYPEWFSNPLIRDFQLPFLARRDNRASQDQLEALLKCVDDAQPDIVYVHNIFDHRVISALKQAHPKRPLVWYAHDHYFYCLAELKMFGAPEYAACDLTLGPQCSTNVLEERCVKRYPLPAEASDLLAERSGLLSSCRLFDRIVVISPYMALTLAQNDPHLKDKITVVPRQVEIPSPRTDRQPRNTVLYSGRIIKEKGVECLIRAVSLIGGDRPILLEVVGGGDDPAYAAHCRELARRAEVARQGLRIEFPGHKSRPEVFRHYQAACVVAVPSLWPEPLGSVALEALAHEVPVVAFDVGGLPTVVKDGETGLLAKAGDFRDLGRKIDLLLRDKALARKLGAQGRDFVERNFSPHMHLEAMGRIFRELSR